MNGANSILEHPPAFAAHDGQRQASIVVLSGYHQVEALVVEERGPVRQRPVVQELSVASVDVLQLGALLGGEGHSPITRR